MRSERLYLVVLVSLPSLLFFFATYMTYMRTGLLISWIDPNSNTHTLLCSHVANEKVSVSSRHMP